MDIPCFINCRDRLTDLRKLVDWLESTGIQRIILMDNDSSYEPLLAYYEETPHEVKRLGQNIGSRAIWDANLAPNEHFVYTDPDVLPHEECPLDAIDYLFELSNRYPDLPKVALGLFIEDLPGDHYLKRAFFADALIVQVRRDS